MVDSVKQYNLSGVSANVELGKQGPIIAGSNSSVISLTDKNGNLTVAAIAQGTDASHAVTLSQFEGSSGQRLKYIKTSVNYNDGNVTIGTATANTYIHSVTVDVTGTWSGANSNTNISVGDSGNNSRLFSGFDTSTQTSDDSDHKYLSSTSVVAYVSQGAASGGSADVTVWYSGTIS